MASALIPGLGQAVNGRMRLARWLAIPAVVLLAVVALVLATKSTPRLIAWLVAPQVLTFMLALNVVVLVWRVVAVLQAFFDGRYRARPSLSASVAIVILIVAVALPHGILNAWGTAAQRTFAQVFPDDRSGEPDPLGPGETATRVNVLLMGVDEAPGRDASLTDSIMVASIDPVGTSVSLLSLPRDLVRVPLANGETYLPKINSLVSYADRHREDFPRGGIDALKGAIGALLGIPIHYYVKIDFFGFVRLVDAVGGVDIDVKNGFYDPEYDGMGVNIWPDKGWGVDPGPHHFTGFQALAYARARKGVGESDFTRAARQQEILLALRTKLASDGSLLLRLPDLLEAFGELVETDMPTARLPELAAVVDELDAESIFRMVVSKPLVRGRMDDTYGSVQVPDIEAIRAVAAAFFPAPGLTPAPWPTTAPLTIDATPGSAGASP